MDLGSPSGLQLNETSEQLIRDVENSARVVRELRPLSPAVVGQIEEDLLGERVYSSNAIEGNTLDLRETVLILKSGVIGAKKIREATEARNLGEAARTLFQWLKQGENCHTEQQFTEIHRILLHDIDEAIAGRYRGTQVMIAGAKYQPPDETRVPGLMQQALDRLRESKESHDVRAGILTAVWAHWALARVHPFVDGNGRMARLWQDLVLYQAGLTCGIIRPEERRDYLDALAAADEGDFNPLIQLVAQRINYALDRYLAAVQTETESRKFLQELGLEADTRMDEKRKLSYMRWSRHMTLLRDAFVFCTGQLSKSTAQVAVQVHPADLIDQTRWENILSGVGAGPTSFFRVDFESRMSGRSLRLRYHFFFGKHYWRDQLDTDDDRTEQRVSLLISEDDGAGKAVRLDQLPNCPIRLREVYLVGDKYVCRIFDPDSKAERYDRSLTHMQIAQEFVRDVILNRLT